MTGGKSKKPPYLLRNVADGEVYKGDHDVGLSRLGASKGSEGLLG